ncbi:thioredoxin family protein [Mesorhizobium qingshengii]|uniref:Thioredoxin family protein n=1 Tax=Mesorhizobium qingshengii TaxID=1165689 RepID=A0ABT4QRR2_9HYPH|nr:thioredoxin family protein [Mesorhizobium qingshengii]MCZ8544093.1 thioredoxin family protein [Mesorhizobium qingshengii]
MAMASRKSLWLAAFALAFSAFAGTGQAGELDKPQSDRGSTDKPLGVVELFTSQGCNSCPPADALFAELAAKEDIVALAYHVDYWDYLGWQDTLSRKENTERQYDYMRAFGSRSVYTPQAVINGRVHVNGASRGEVDGALARLAKTGEGMRVAIKVSRTSDRVMIDAGDAGAGPSDAHVVIVYFDPPQTIKIGQGENTGRKMTYWNAVTGIQTAGMWHGKAQRYELPMSEISKKGGCAVLLQSVGKDGLPGPILGAAFIHKP